MAGTPEPKSATQVTSAQLNAIAADLLDFASKLQAAARVAENQPDKSLAIFNWASALNGVKFLRAFVAKADESRSSAELGTPIKAGQLKPRSTARKKAEAKKTLDEGVKRATKKFKSKE